MHAQRTHHVARNALPRPRLTRLSFSTVYGSQCRFRARLLEQLLQLAVLLGVPLLRAHRRARLHPGVHCRNNAAAPLSSAAAAPLSSAAAAPLSSVRCGRA